MDTKICGKPAIYKVWFPNSEELEESDDFYGMIGYSCEEHLKDAIANGATWHDKIILDDRSK